MADARLRELERRWRASGAPQDEAAWLAARVQAGDLAPERLSLAALVGHEAALLAGGAPLPDPLAGRDQAAWERVDAFARGDRAAIEPLLADPERRRLCAHEYPWLQRLLDVEDAARREGFRLLRCWTCEERLMVQPIDRSLVSPERGAPLELRGLPLIDQSLLDARDVDEAPLLFDVEQRRWAWGLGAHDLEASLRAEAAAVRLTLTLQAWERPRDAQEALAALAAFERWIVEGGARGRVALPPEQLMTVRFDEPWAYLLADASAPEGEAAALARRAVHRACLVLDEREVQAAVRTALAPWALGYGDPLRA